MIALYIASVMIVLIGATLYLWGLFAWNVAIQVIGGLFVVFGVAGAMFTFLASLLKGVPQ